MDEVGETSSAPTSSATERPLVVRVKRKPSQSPLEAFWLEISERPLKRALLDLEKLSLSGSSGKEESRTRRVFVKHLETVSSSKNIIDALQSFVQSGSDNSSRFSSNSRVRHPFRKENKQDQLLSKAKQQQEALSKTARFEQIWRSRKGNTEEIHDEELHEVCHLYDVVRVDTEGITEKANKKEKLSKEDQESLYKFMSLLREHVPDAAEDIESDVDSSVCEQDAFVYDLYTVGDNADEMDDSNPFPLVQVNDDDEWFVDGPDDSDYETDDSNAECHRGNEYPEEIDEEDESETSTDESEDGEEETESKESTSDEDPKNLDVSDSDMDNDYFDENVNMGDSRHAYSYDDEDDEDYRMYNDYRMY